MWSLPMAIGWVCLGLGASTKALMTLVPRLRQRGRFVFYALCLAVVICIALNISPLGRNNPAGPWGRSALFAGFGLWLFSGIVQAVAWIRRQ